MGDPYATFLSQKSPSDRPSGLKQIPPLNPKLKPFQRAPTEWALRRGRAALFEDTGLGKTLQQLEWARIVSEHEQAPILGLTPLAVAEQTVAEAAKFGIDGVTYAWSQGSMQSNITITNYDRLHLFDPSIFAGVFLDESSIIKSHDSKTRATMIETFRDTPWKLCCSATPAPNDYTELGNHAEFLNVMTEKEMLSMFFVHDGSVRAHAGASEWRLKRHAEQDFWRWLSSWAAVIRSPADLGFDEPGYILPRLIHHQINVEVEYKPQGGMLFPMEARTMSERLSVRRDSIDARTGAALQIICKSIIGNILSRSCYQTKPRNDAAPRGGSDMRPIQSDEPPTRKPPLPIDDPRPEKLINEPITSPIRKNSNQELQIKESATMPLDAPNILQIQNTEIKSSNKPKFLQNENEHQDSELQKNNMMPSWLNRAAGAQYAAEKMEILPADRYMLTTATKPASFEDSSVPTAILASGNLEMMLTYLKRQSSTCWNPKDRWIVWCQLNKEQDRIADKLGDLCFSVYGTLPNDEKKKRVHRWLAGERPVLVSKVMICGFGMNFQICSNMVFVGLNDSFEQLYQAKRRCWRYGQTEPVHVYMIASELEGAVVANLERKEREFEEMQANMAIHMRDLVRAEVLGERRVTGAYAPSVRMEAPQWLRS